MVQVQQRILIGVWLVSAAWGSAAYAERFHDDDPIAKVPPPRRVESARVRAISDFYDFFMNTFTQRGENHVPVAKTAAEVVNTLDEVPDSPWFENRHALRRMSREELQRGAGDGNPPSMDGPWKVISARSVRLTPGFTMEDARGRRYLVKLDSRDAPDMATSADVIGSRFFHALGYYTPENYIVHFSRSRLLLTPETMTGEGTRQWRMREGDLKAMLRDVPRDREGNYRGMASLFLRGELIGPFRYEGTRRDDPNDVVPHEHRRDLRALHAFSAWLGHTDITSLNTQDAIVEENGLRFVKHYLIDFDSILGSGGTKPKSPRAGNIHLFEFKPAITQMLTFGLVVPQWMRTPIPRLPSVGRFDSELFDPDHWKPNYPNPAFKQRLPDDDYWAAKQVMAFSDDDIRTLVEAGQCSDSRAVDWLVRVLTARRDKLGRAFFEKVLPLDRFAVRQGRLHFTDLAVEYKFSKPREYAVRWFSFDNATGSKSPLGGQTTLALPSMESKTGSYLAAEIRSTESGTKAVTVYVRKRGDEHQVVGIDRSW